jgi:hypothetical protein
MLSDLFLSNGFQLRLLFGVGQKDLADQQRGIPLNPSNVVKEL